MKDTVVDCGFVCVYVFVFTKFLLLESKDKAVQVF